MGLQKFTRLFKKGRTVIIGMVHLKSLPGTPGNRLKVEDITEIACAEAEGYKKLGVDGIIVENMHDIPYLHSRDVSHEITASMATTCYQIRKECPDFPIGIQVLSGANQQALAIALATGLDFIRAEGYVFAHIADEGMMNACAGELLRYRKNIGAEHIQVLTDIKKKHSSHALTCDVNITDTAKAAEFFLSDGVVITGGATGEPASVDELKVVQDSVNIPVLIGSGVTEDNLHEYSNANGIIVGSSFKMDGKWGHEVDFNRVQRFMNKARLLESKKLPDSSC
ncbi:uncharacterized protein F13E9.13, mitochondrial-like [Anneissia japonica]|uniref:uncharacterized protein F13E9.13, mitochondrial-like n=1 Tax=Anneissia japonica TaxID=1529436 RepID=UPI001425B1A7|nr:uncharacterized protein F13E9.13, mitochondrial-like [Anneissia japonica]